MGSDQSLPHIARVGDKTLSKVSKQENQNTEATPNPKSRKRSKPSKTPPLEVTYVNPALLREVKITADRIVNDPSNSYTRKRVINSTTVIVT